MTAATQMRFRTNAKQTQDVFRALVVENAKGECEGCGLPVRGERAYRVPRLPGVHCSMACIESALLAGARCRWCADKIERPYTGIESRLCSEDCRANYFAHVFGDYTAELATGKRFLAWLQRKQPSIYRQIIGGTTPVGYCQNPQCPNGENGQSASLAHLRAGTKYCSESCKKQALRDGGSQKVLTGNFDPSQTPVLCGFSRDTSGELKVGGLE